MTGCTLPGTTICAGSSIDMQILYDLFGYYLKAAEILGHSSPIVAQVSKGIKKGLLTEQGGSGWMAEEGPKYRER